MGPSLDGRSSRIPAFGARKMPPGAAFGISPAFAGLSPVQGQVAHALLALPPLSRPNIATGPIPFDLHA